VGAANRAKDTTNGNVMCAALGTKDDSIVLFAKVLTTTTAHIKICTVLAKGGKAKGALFRNAAMRETRTIVAKGLATLAASLESTSTHHTKLRHAVRTVSNLLTCRAYTTPDGDSLICRFGLAAVLAHILFLATHATTSAVDTDNLVAIFARHKQSTFETRTTATADALSTLVASSTVCLVAYFAFTQLHGTAICILHT